MQITNVCLFVVTCDKTNFAWKVGSHLVGQSNNAISIEISQKDRKKSDFSRLMNAGEIDTHSQGPGMDRCTARWIDSLARCT